MSDRRPPWLVLGNTATVSWRRSTVWIRKEAAESQRRVRYVSPAVSIAGGIEGAGEVDAVHDAVERTRRRHRSRRHEFAADGSDAGLAIVVLAPAGHLLLSRDAAGVVFRRCAERGPNRVTGGGECHGEWRNVAQDFLTDGQRVHGDPVAPTFSDAISGDCAGDLKAGGD